MALNEFLQIVNSKQLSDYAKDVLIRRDFPSRYQEWLSISGYKPTSPPPGATPSAPAPSASTSMAKLPGESDDAYLRRVMASIRGTPLGGGLPSVGGAIVRYPTEPARPGFMWKLSGDYYYEVPDPNYRKTQQPIPGAGPGEEPFRPGQIITLADGSQLYYTYDAQGNPIPHFISTGTKQISPEDAARLAWEKEKYASLSAEEKRRADLEQQRLAWEKERYGQISPAEQKRIDIEYQRIAAESAWRQQQTALEKESRLAELRAKPASWLEYASLAGQPAVVQPWMIGLLPQGSNLAVGQQIPGSQGGSTTMSGMPELTRPSQQYLARVGPTPTQKYYGYERARTGAPLEQTAWWLGEMAAPGGRFGGLSRRR